MKTTNSCNICNSIDFKPGPNGRISNGILPMCGVCGSLERHRAIYKCYELFFKKQPSMLMESSALQFAKDVSINNKWFKSWDYSEYGGHNSLNIMNLKMENGSIDWLILNHILEHVSNDVIAIKELARVLTASGVIQITVPSPLYSLDTHDWGFADPSINYHYREYGADLSLKLGAICRDLSLNAIVALPFDAVSSTFEAVYFLTKQHARCKAIYMILKSGNIPSIRIN